jgi:hypothetical protein
MTVHRLPPVHPDDDYLVQVAIMNWNLADGDPYDFSLNINSSSLRFGPAGAAQGATRQMTDIDGDGDDDMLAYFEMQDSGIACGDTEVELIGERNAAYGDVPIPLIGVDNIQTEDCTVSSCHP